MDETQFNVAQLLREPVGSRRSFPFQSRIEIGEPEKVSFHGQLELLRIDKGVFVQALLEALVPQSCSRCLTPLTHPLRVQFKEEYYSTVEVNLGYRLPPPEDSSAFIIDENHILDVEEAIRQYALLALPLKPLCQPQCAGLCPNCGWNLNQGPCQCPAPLPDPRWAALRDLVMADSKLGQ